MFANLLETLTKKPERIVSAYEALLSSPVYLLLILLLLVGFYFLISFRKISFTTDAMTKIAILLALATVLNMMIIFRMPQGGSVTLASMVPIYLLALAFGPEIGMLGGLLFGIIDMFLGASIYHPIQVLLDYPLAFMFIGLVAFFPKRVNLGMFIATSFRLACHVLSGYIFFGAYAPQGSHPLVYSFGYNASFLMMDLVIALLVINFLPINRLAKALNKEASQLKMW